MKVEQNKQQAIIRQADNRKINKSECMSKQKNIQKHNFRSNRITRGAQTGLGNRRRTKEQGQD